MKDQAFYDYEQKFYDRLYTLHETGEKSCENSIYDIVKARKRVAGVFSFFNIDPGPKACALDVGCGSGYYSEALHRHGIQVTGIDISPVAVENARRRFSGPDFKVALFPEAVRTAYDLIWAVDVSPLNTLDSAEIGQFVSASLDRLNPGGVLVIGWHTDFCGQVKDYWACWSVETIGQLCRIWGFEGPAIVETKRRAMNYLCLNACRIIRKSAPIFMVLKT